MEYIYSFILLLLLLCVCFILFLSIFSFDLVSFVHSIGSFHFGRRTKKEMLLNKIDGEVNRSIGNHVKFSGVSSKMSIISLFRSHHSSIYFHVFLSFFFLCNGFNDNVKRIINVFVHLFATLNTQTCLFDDCFYFSLFHSFRFISLLLYVICLVGALHIAYDIGNLLDFLSLQKKK